MSDPSKIDGSDRISLRDLRVVAVVGVLPQERTNPQPLSIDVDIYTDLTSAGLSDSLDDSVDYGSVCSRIVEVVTDGAPLLLERLAHLIAEDLLGAFPMIEAVTIEVRKLRPPVPQDLATSGVAITRRRSRG